ncbi:hypothetical protein FACS1894204_03930 [Synergistales bacterium]|nr:hypothetical protein FACS1894204_03930 [Synergistales bacterium]
MPKKSYDIGSNAPIGAEYAETEVTQSPEQPSAEAAQVYEPPVAKTTRLAYVGPNVPGGVLQRFQVFKGGLPPYCKDLLDKIPEMKELFVPVEFLEDFRRKIEEPGTNEARLFFNVKKAFDKGVK